MRRQGFYKMKKKLVIGCAVAILALGIAYGTGVFCYKDKFFKGTSINGIDCGNLTAKEAEEVIRKDIEDYSLELLFKDDKKEVIQGSEIDYEYVSNGNIEKLQKEQNLLLWITGFFGQKREYQEEEEIKFDTEKLKAKIESLESMQDENMTPPVNAYIAFENNQFIIKDEAIGTALDKEAVVKQVRSAVEKSEKKWSAEEAEVYQKPSVTKEDATLRHQQEVWNRCAAVTVTYTFGEQKELLDGMVVKDWMTYDEAGNYVEDTKSLQKHIRTYVNALSAKYNTVGRSRTITSTATGQPVQVEGGSYGFLIDTEKECNQLLADIQGHVNTVREPIYARAGVAYAENDIGNTYVELDLTAQHLWYYKDGTMIMDTDFVSGTYYNTGRRTPGGTYYLYYKQRNQVLRPAPNPDGSYDYESPVDYWMPFNGGIGLHDANWRWKFGGSIYLYSGSHGCINLPVSFAGKFYESIEAGCPIVCFYR